MQSRMEKYGLEPSKPKSRTQKNQQLYDDLKTSVLADFDVNSNVSVIGEQDDVIDVEKIKMLLDQKYNTNNTKRRSIEIPDYPETEIEDNIVDTKEYDINAILEKAKKGKNVDYNKERLRKIRETQIEILNNLDLELKRVEEGKKSIAVREDEEENLVDLMNTITKLEKQNMQEVANGETDDLFDDLLKTRTMAIPTQSDSEEDNLSDEEDVVTDVEEIKLFEEEKDLCDNIQEEKEEEILGEPEEDKKGEEKAAIERIDSINEFEDFQDISKGEGLNVFLRILAFMVVIGLVLGVVYIINNVLELGLF